MTTQNHLSSFSTLIDWAEKNNISADIFPRDTKSLEELKVLKLHNQNLCEIPSEISLLGNLEELYLNGNILKNLPDSLGKLKKLEILWLQDNQLISLPQTFSQLEQLKELVVFDNKLQEIDSKIVSLQNLKALYVHRNYLSKETIILLKSKEDMQISWYDQQKLPIKISNLCTINLQDAITLRDSVFTDIDKYESQTLKASLHKDNCATIYKKLKIDFMKYFVAKVENKVVGLVGIYTHIDKPDIAWLGWYCVDSNFRGRNIGEKLLDFVTNKVSSFGFSEFHLYTGMDDFYNMARKLYQTKGFELYKTDKKNGLEYWSKKLINRKQFDSKSKFANLVGFGQCGLNFLDFVPFKNRFEIFHFDKEKQNDYDTLYQSNLPTFLIAGLSGKFGTQNIYEVAKALLDRNLEFHILVIMPFSWEGNKRSNIAQEMLNKLQRLSNNVSVYHNDDLKSECGKIILKEQFRLINTKIFKYVLSKFGSFV